ncbi:MAG: TetR/AcrR family transcriptional regulator [Candidatus Bathyarchaeia archaeon]|jgi:AcrR family transcriptional regulator
MPKTDEANQQIREEQRTKILSAAKKVFARKGKAATMADVAAEAGVSQGLAYRYFASKEEMLTTLVKQAAQDGGGPAARIREIQGTPGKRLALLVSYLLEDRREHPGFYQFFYQVLADDTMPNDLRQLVQSNGRVIQDIMRQLIVEGQASGEIAKDDPDQLMTALMACFDGLVKRTTWLDPEDAKKHFPEVKIIMRILKPDGQEGKRPQ